MNVLRSFLFILMFGASIPAFDGLALLDTISDNSWVMLPRQSVVTPQLVTQVDITRHTNITVDCDSHRVYYYGSDTHGNDYHNNLILYFDLKTFTWRNMYFKDQPTTWIKVESAVIGSGKFWPATSTGHPVPSHVFDASKYIPGKQCILVLQSHRHNYRFNGDVARHDGLLEIMGSFGEPTAWLWDCRALQWTLLKNGPAPNVFIWPIGVSPDGQKIIATNSGNTYTFDWADSTWSQLSTSGQKHSTYHTALEYDTHADKFVECGAHNFEYYTLDYSDKIWQKVAGDNGPAMNGPYIGYDTLNKVLIAHCADNPSNTYSNPGGKAKTWIRASATGQWTLMKSTDAGDYLPAHYGLGCRGEYDLANNVFYFMDEDYEMWAYRYKKGKTRVEKPLQGISGIVIAAVPNPSYSTVKIVINKPVSALSHFAIYDIHGRMVKQFRVTHGGSYTWNASGLSGGVYFIQWYSSGKRFFKKVVLHQ